MTCSVSENCLNNGRCFNCCYDGDKFSEFGNELYNPIDSIKSIHPIKQARLEKKRQDKLRKRNEEKIAKRQQQRQDKIEKEKNKNKDKQKILKSAARAEQRIKSTINSGRVNCDGDLKTSDLTLDVKLQTASKDWTVHRDEFLKVQGDAQRGNRRHGVLTIVNSLDEAIYVISPELFLILLDFMEE